jgi:hypothetical protein
LSPITHAEFGKEKGRMVRVEMREGDTAWRIVAVCFSCALMCVFKSEPWLGLKRAVSRGGNNIVMALQKQRSRI